MPRISVIVPVYKVEKYLNRCVDSVLNQTFKDFEIILVDDGSPDNCPVICDEYASKYDFVHVIHKENGGLSDARNEGIDWAFKNSDSEYITFIDSDDWVHAQYLELLYNACVENGIDISCCAYEKVKEFSKESVNTKVLNIDVDVDAIENLVAKKYKFEQLNMSTAWARLYKKELWKEIRFPVGRFHEDEFTTYKLLFACDKIAVIKSVLYYYFENANGIMGSKISPKRVNDMIDALYGQCVFFAEHNYETIFYFNAKRLFWVFKSNYAENRNNRQIKQLLASKRKCLCVISDKNPKIVSLFSKYGYKKWITGRAERIRDFKKDNLLVRKEKGLLFSMFYYIKHFYKAYFGEI